jgi:hypothetical protein
MLAVEISILPGALTVTTATSTDMHLKYMSLATALAGVT